MMIIQLSQCFNRALFPRWYFTRKSFGMKSCPYTFYHNKDMGFQQKVSMIHWKTLTFFKSILCVTRSLECRKGSLTKGCFPLDHLLLNHGVHRVAPASSGRVHPQNENNPLSMSHLRKALLAHFNLKDSQPAARFNPGLRSTACTNTTVTYHLVWMIWFGDNWLVPAFGDPVLCDPPRARAPTECSTLLTRDLNGRATKAAPPQRP